jgi:C4-dicarboxylate transporter DctM subunit
MRLLDAAPRLDRRRRVGMGALAILLLVLVFGFGDSAAAFDGDGDSSSVGGALATMLAALLAMVALGMPLFVIIGVLAALAFWLIGEDFDGLNTLDVFSDEVTKLTGNSVLLAIPFFVASGAIMSAGSIASRLVAFARAVVGWMPGGLSIATVWACVFFAAISGSSPVTVIAIGSMMYPALLKSGYERRFSLGLLSSAGSLGILIPPSIPMLVYAIVAGGRRPLDVSELFLAGVVPGLFIGLLLSGYGMFIGLRQGTRDEFVFADVWNRFTEGFWAISLPFVILGGIYSGVFTPTEAAGVSVVYALIVEILIHREITIFDLPKILTDACVTMGTILIIMALAVSLNIFLVEEMIPNRVVEWIQSMELTPIGFLIIVNVFLLIVGAVMDSISAILIIAPLLAPIAYELGIDPVHLGVIFIVNLEIGYLTPPIGINLFVASSVFRRPMGEVARGVLPFIGLMAIGLGTVAYVPTVSMGLVNVFLRDKDMYEPFPEAATSEGEGEGGDDGGLAAPPTQTGPTGKKIYSVEELMEMDTGDLEEEDDEDDWGEEEADESGTGTGG